MAFGWYFEPDAADIEQCRGFVCPCASGETFKTEVQAIRDGKRWIKECHRTGTVTAVPDGALEKLHRKLVGRLTAQDVDVKEAPQ